MSKKRLTVFEIALFGVLGAVMFVSKTVMEWLPNIHLLGTLIVAYTVVFRAKALISLYTYVMIDGLLHGFAGWWIPYLYIWTVLWGAVMLLPRRMPARVAAVVYPCVSAVHGLLFGLLYAPATAVLYFNMDFEPVLAWWIAGLPFDGIHAASNLLCGVLILPLVGLLRRAERLAVNK